MQEYDSDNSYYELTVMKIKTSNKNEIKDLKMP